VYKLEARRLRCQEYVTQKNLNAMRYRKFARFISQKLKSAKQDLSDHKERERDQNDLFSYVHFTPYRGKVSVAVISGQIVISSLDF
jgi:hypothetical protein